MHIAINESVSGYGSILTLFPPTIKRLLLNINLDEAEEIRLIFGQPILLRYHDGDYFLNHKGILSQDVGGSVKLSRNDIEGIVERLTKASVYAVTEEIKNGYITIDGGHRVGITGTAVIGDGGVEYIKNISAMNIRIANEVVGISRELCEKITEGGLNNTLIISPPGCGKTTLLRDIARELSDGGYNVAISDERCEIAGMVNGVASFTLGMRTAVLENCPKAYAINTLLRSMSPEVIICDELGRIEDCDAVFNAVNSGVGVIASAHGRDTEQLQNRVEFKRLLKMFDLAVILSRRNGVGTIERVEDIRDA